MNEYVQSSTEATQHGSRHGRRRDRRGTSADIVTLILAVAVMDVFTFVHVPYLLAAEVARGLVGLLIALVAPGFVAVASIFPRQGDISLLLRWVLIIAISCFYDVVLTFVMGGVGIRLNPDNTAAFDTVVLVLGAFWVIWARRRAGLRGYKIHSWKREISLFPYLITGATLLALVLWMLIPNFQTAKPVLYVTSTSGQMAIPYRTGAQTLRFQVHVKNPQTQAMTVDLREYLNGRQQGPPLRHRVSANGTWTHKVTLIVPGKGRGRATFVLSDPNHPLLQRKVWIDYGT